MSTARDIFAEPWALQEHLAAIVESSDDAIVSKDLDGIIRSWNRSAERIFGYTAEEAVGQHISMLAPPDRVGEISQILIRISRGERIDHYHSKRRAKDGRILSVSLTISPIRDATGKVVGASKIARDITVESRFEELQAHLAAIVESSDDAIISKNLNGIIQSWNRGAEHIFGYTAEEAVGRHISMLAPPDRVNEIPNILERISRGERVDHYQTRRQTKDGRVLAISLTVSPIRDPSGTVIGASKIARDVTEQLRYQEALRRANESLRRSNSDLEQFAYSASHDLQEPLRMVAAYSKLLQRKFGGALVPRGDEYIGYIVNGAMRMEGLLRDLRAYMLASTMNQRPEELADSKEALLQALKNLQLEIDESGAAITYGPLPRVRMQAVLLEQVLQNLIGNAIRYRGHNPPVIKLSAERCGDAWKFSVQDNGIGIDPRYYAHVFGMFKRLHSAAEYSGTGMGLALCQRIVERAGGRIWVESEGGRGSTFFFTVPANGGLDNYVGNGDCVSSAH